MTFWFCLFSAFSLIVFSLCHNLHSSYHFDCWKSAQRNKNRNKHKNQAKNRRKSKRMKRNKCSASLNTTLSDNSDNMKKIRVKTWPKKAATTTANSFKTSAIVGTQIKSSIVMCARRVNGERKKMFWKICQFYTFY